MGGEGVRRGEEEGGKKGLWLFVLYHLRTEQQFIRIYVHDGIKMSILDTTMIIGTSFVSVLVSHVSHGAIGLRSVSPVLFHVVVDLVAESLVFGVDIVVFGWIDLLIECVERVCCVLRGCVDKCVVC